jgi:hypothetical protein
MMASATIDAPRDEQCIAGCRHRGLLVAFSVVKRYLAQDIPADFRLRFLQYFEKFEGLTDGWLSADAVAMIDPICDNGYEIVEETRKLVPPKQLFEMLAKLEAFHVFAALNPSLTKVIRYCSEKREVCQS